MMTHKKLLKKFGDDIFQMIHPGELPVMISSATWQAILDQLFEKNLVATEVQSKTKSTKALKIERW